MRANVNLFWILTAFFAIVAAVYAYWSWADEGDPGIEWAGTIAVSLAAVLSAFIAFYLGRVHKAQGAELPEDRLDANIDDGDAELGFFSPWSWWPVLLAAGVALDVPRYRDRILARLLRSADRTHRTHRVGLRVLPWQLRPIATDRRTRSRRDAPGPRSS